MRAGKLRHQIEIQQEMTKRSEFTTAEAWQTLIDASASIEPTNGKESDASPLVSADVSHKITLRYQPGVKPSQRVKFGRRLFNIKAVINVDERNVELNLFCVEVIA